MGATAAVRKWILDMTSHGPGSVSWRRMVYEIAAQSDGDGRYRAGSMYQAWKGWSFADKKHPSPWLTTMVLRVQARLEDPDAA